MVVAAEDVAGVVSPDSGADGGAGGGPASSSYPPGGGQAQTGPHFFARGSTRQAVSLPTTSPLSFLRAKSSGSASPKPSNARMVGIESERGVRAPTAPADSLERPVGGRSRNSGALRRVESERRLCGDDDDSGGSLQSSLSSTDLAYDDDMGRRSSVDAQTARSMLDTQLNDQFHAQKKNSLAFISFFKNAQKYSDSLQESANYGSEMSQAMIKMTKTAPNSEEDSEVIESMAVSWGGMMQLQQHFLRPLFTEDEFAEKFQLYEGVAEVVALEKEYKKQHATYTQRLKKYEKSIRKERTRKAKQNSAALVSDSIDMQLLQTSFDEWRAQTMEELVDMERVRQARFACLFWQNLERQLEHYRTFISLLEKEKNSWESRYRDVAGATATTAAAAKGRTEVQSVRESRKGKHHSAGEAMRSNRLSSSPRSAGEFLRSSPPQPKGVSFAHEGARNDTDSESFTSDSEAALDPFEEEEEDEEDKLLRGELEEKQHQQQQQHEQKTTNAQAPLNKTKRPNSKRQSTIALASQLLDWCFQTDPSATAMPITRKTRTADDNDHDDEALSPPPVDDPAAQDTTNSRGRDVGEDKQRDGDDKDDDEEDKQPIVVNNNNFDPIRQKNSERVDSAEGESEMASYDRQRFPSTADILDSIFAAGAAAAPSSSLSPAASAADVGAASERPPVVVRGGGLAGKGEPATQYRPSAIGSKSQRVSIGCRRRASPAASPDSIRASAGEDKSAEREQDGTSGSC